MANAGAIEAALSPHDIAAGEYGCGHPAYPRPREARGGGDAEMAVVLVQAELVQDSAFDCPEEEGSEGEEGGRGEGCLLQGMAMLGWSGREKHCCPVPACHESMSSPVSEKKTFLPSCLNH